MFSNDVLNHAWIPITIAAAAAQTLRTMVQKRLTATLTATTNTFARYLCGLPFVALYLAGVLAATGNAMPSLNTDFMVNVIIGGAAQIVATALLILAFSARGYAVGVTLSKTEALQASLFAVIILGERTSLAGMIAIVVSAVGVIVMTAPGERATLQFDRAAVLGLLSGTLFGITAVCIRAANLALDAPFVTAAATTLATMVALQTLALGLYVIWRQGTQLRALASAWRPVMAVGLFSALGSIGWFTGMALEKAAYVRTLGQVELVFTVLASRFYFREGLTQREVGGIALVGAGIATLLALG